MPIDDRGRIVCVTHNDRPMEKQPIFHFLTQAERGPDGGLKVLNSSGMPLHTFVCMTCGYVENYAVVATRELNTKQLYVRCKNENCGREFLSPIQMDEETFRTSELKINQYGCYFCRQTSTYDKEDHFFR